MDTDIFFITARLGLTPSLAQPEDLGLDAETEHQASLEWFERRLRSYADQIVGGLSAEQRRDCGDLSSVIALSPCG